MKNKSSIPEYLNFKYYHAQIPSFDNIHSSIDIKLFPHSRRGDTYAQSLGKLCSLTRKPMNPNLHQKGLCNFFDEINS